MHSSHQAQVCRGLSIPQQLVNFRCTLTSCCKTFSDQSSSTALRRTQLTLASTVSALAAHAVHRGSFRLLAYLIPLYCLWLMDSSSSCYYALLKNHLCVHAERAGQLAQRIGVRLERQQAPLEGPPAQLLEQAPQGPPSSW